MFGHPLQDALADVAPETFQRETDSFTSGLAEQRFLPGPISEQDRPDRTGGVWKSD